MLTHDPGSTVGIPDSYYEAGLSREPKVRDAAWELALLHADTNDIPARFRSDYVPGKSKKRNKEYDIERRFREIVAGWSSTIETLLSRIEADADTAWRLILRKPRVEAGLDSVTQSGDFQTFVNYLVLRRDIARCDARELGCLCSLLDDVQHTIESAIHSNSSTS